jgi:hypothetical protein
MASNDDRKHGGSPDPGQDSLTSELMDHVESGASNQPPARGSVSTRPQRQRLSLPPHDGRRRLADAPGRPPATRARELAWSLEEEADSHGGG